MIAGLMAEEPPPEDRLVLAEFLPFRLALAAQAVNGLIAATCEERFGLTSPAWRLLCVLAEAERLGSSRAFEAAGLGAKPGWAAAAMLVGKGLVLRSPADGVLGVTALGRSAHHDVAGLALAAEAALVAGLTPAEVYCLQRLLGRVQLAAEKLTVRPTAA